MFEPPISVNSSKDNKENSTNNTLETNPPITGPSKTPETNLNSDTNNHPMDNPGQSANEANKVNDPSPSIDPPAEDVGTKKRLTADLAKNKDTKGYIGFRVSNEMKQDLEDMAQEFAYLARKQYGLKIKDDSSSILRAFLTLGMSCFTEKIRLKTLQEYDPDSTLEEEVTQQLLAIMRIHKVEIDELA